MHLTRSQSALTILGLGIALTIAYHFLPAHHPYGIPIAIFSILINGAAITISKLREEPPNAWAYLFLIPTMFAIAAETLYASPVVRVFGYCVIFASLALFAYWLTMPREKLAEVKHFWPHAFFADTLLPFPALRSFFASISTGGKGLRVLIGIFVAIPFLLIIGTLFASADPLFNKAITDPFKDWNFATLIPEGLRDMFLALFFVAFGFTMFIRRHTDKKHHETPTHEAIGSTILPTALILVNVLFAAFVAFQIPYFFGDQSFVQQYGLTYADYARSGFFQLITVAGIVFGAALGVYLVTEMRGRLVKILTLTLITQTFVVMLSAAKRLGLYTDAYGLSVSRWWATASILIIAFVLIVVALSALARVHSFQLLKSLTFIALLSASVPLVLNVERLVADHNINRYLRGETQQLDVIYLTSLSSDAVPSLVRLSTQSKLESFFDEMSQTNVPATALRDYFSRSLDALQKNSSDWRNLVVSDYQAMAALGSVK